MRNNDEYCRVWNRNHGEVPPYGGCWTYTEHIVKRGRCWYTHALNIGGSKHPTELDLLEREGWETVCVLGVMATQACLETRQPTVVKRTIERRKNIGVSTSWGW